MTALRCHIDLETRSTLDLRRTGAYVYAAHPTTEIILVCWAIGDDPVQTWCPLHDPEMPLDLAVALHDPTVTLCAHNTSFERTLLSGSAGTRLNGGVPLDRVADVARWNCTAARAARAGLPRTLDGAASALALPLQKDAEGARLMLQMCKPRRTSDGSLAWWQDETRLARLGEYCVRDVDVERLIDGAIPELSAFESDVWRLTETINDRGVAVDMPALDDLSRLVLEVGATVNVQIAVATGGAVRSATDPGALSRWLAERGVETKGVAKAVVAELLGTDALDPDVREALLLRQEGGKASAAKYKAIRQRVSEDGRMRGALKYCGAASTGRFSSTGAQLQNLPRPSLIKSAAKVEAALSDLRAGVTLDEFRAAYGPPMSVASELLRPLFRAGPGRMLARGDSKQIEARVTPWLSGAGRVLDAYRRFDAGAGPDLYKVAAGGIYGVDPATIGDEDNRRQVGKVSSLALGFGSGVAGLQAMAKQYRLVIPAAGERPDGAPFDWPVHDGTDEWIKRQWRAANPEIVAAWATCHTAAIECMTTAPGAVWRAGAHITFRRNARAMVMRLPSGTNLVYWSPRVVEQEMPWGGTRPSIRFMAEDSLTKRWTLQNCYGGLLLQNAVQGFARDLMAWWLLEGAAAGLEPVLSVHDEGIFEADGAADAAAARVSEVMCRVPPWAAGLPVGADATANARYVKG